MRHPKLFIFCALISLSLLGGCRYSNKTKLPAHIKTVEVQTFLNKTWYKGIEGKLTRQIIERINLTPGLRVVNSGGDALLTGRILGVNNSVTRKDAKAKPSSILVTISAEYSLEDMIEQRFVVENGQVTSNKSNHTTGQFDIDREEPRAAAENSAIKELAMELVREIAVNR